jgi:hypothetical protein
MAIKVLDVMIAIGKYLLPITVALALLSTAGLLNSIATGNIVGAVFWGFLALMGFIFAIQIAQRRKSQPRIRRRVETRKEYTSAAQA